MRIPEFDLSKPPLVLRPLFAMMRRRVGKVLTPYKAWAYRPGPAFWFAMFMNSLESSKLLPEPTKRLVCLRSAQLIGCVF
jgi:alkylhydroperoxidase family enzyme